MKKRMDVQKKVFLFLLVLCIVGVNCFASGDAGKTKKVYLITVLFLTPSQQPTEDNRVFQRLKEEFGVTFEFDIIAGDADQKIGVVLAGGDFPDLMDAHQRFLDNDVFIPLEDLVEEHAPRLRSHYDQCWELIKHEDGHIYVLPNWGVYEGEFKANESWGPSFWIQKDVLKEFGFPKVQTLDEYFDIIIKYKEKYPTIDGQPTIGFEILCEGWRNFCLKNAPQHLVGYPNDGDVIVENNKAVFFGDKDIAKRYYKKLNEMNQLGIIDRESFVLSYDQYIAKLSSGRVLGMFDQKWNFNRANSSLIKQDKTWRTFAPCPVVYDTSIRDYYMDRPVVNVDRGFGISTNCKDPVRIIKLWDSLMSEEWQIFYQWGVEGVDYLVDENGMFYMTDEMRDRYRDLAWKQANTGLMFFDHSPKWEGTYSDGNATSPGLQPIEYFESLKAEDKEFLAAYGYKTFADFFSPPPPNRPHYPVWSLNLTENSPGGIARTKLNDLANKYLPKVILADPGDFDAVWDEYVNEIRKVDVQAHEDEVNELIKLRVKKVTGK